MAARGSEWARASYSEDRKEKLLAACAKRARLMEPAELKAIFPTWSVKDISYLRCEREDYFGWERLLYIAEQLDIEVIFEVAA